MKDEISVEMLEAASLYEPVTGRKMTVMTDLPAVLLYTAGYYERPDTAVCLETQFYPDTLLIRIFLPAWCYRRKLMNIVPCFIFKCKKRNR
mgnify:CR=1 FL=1